MTPLPIPNPCIKCGYTLVGLPQTGRCPECATPIELSLGEPTLSTANPANVVRLRRGITIILVTFLLQLALWLVTFPFGGQASSTLNLSKSDFLIVSCGLALALTALGSFGYWWFADPAVAPRSPGLAHRPSEPGNAAGTILRLVVLGRLASALFVFAAMLLTRANSSSPLAQVAELVLFYVDPVLRIIQTFAVLRHTHWLGRRVPDDRLLSLSDRYVWLFPGIFFASIVFFCAAAGQFLTLAIASVGPALIIILYGLLLARLHIHLTSILSTGAPANLPGRRYRAS